MSGEGRADARGRRFALALAGRLWLPLAVFGAFSTYFMYQVSAMTPRASMYPIGVAVLVLLLIAVVCVGEIRALRQIQAEGGAAAVRPRPLAVLTSPELWKAAVAAAWVALFVYFVRRLGLPLTSAGLVMGLSLCLGVRNPLMLIALGVGAWLVAYLFFLELLGVALPRWPS